MSSNNAIVIVDEPDGTYSVWYDGCVDDPFPSAASCRGKFATMDEAMQCATDEGYTEYGISHISGPVECADISDDDSRWCCGLLYGHDGEHDYSDNWDPPRERSEFECERCSSESRAVMHGAGMPCDRDPEYVVNIIAEALGERDGYMQTYAIAHDTLRAIGWQRGLTVTIDGMGKVVHD